MLKMARWHVQVLEPASRARRDEPRVTRVSELYRLVEFANEPNFAGRIACMAPIVKQTKHADRASKRVRFEHEAFRGHCAPQHISISP